MANCERRSWYDCWEQCSCINKTERCIHGYHRKGHDGCTAELKACPNFEVCGHKDPPDLMACWGDKCLDCDMHLRVDLTFVDGPIDCPICLEDQCARGVVFPGGCVHAMCVSCFRELMLASFWHEEDHHIPDLKCPMCRRDPSQNPARRWSNA